MDTRRVPRELAIDLLDRSVCDVQVAAVLVDRYGKIFSWGWNHAANRAEGEVGVHAEHHAIMRANPNRLEGTTLVVAGRRRKSGNFVFSKPCSHKKSGRRFAHNTCMELIRKKGIKKIEYTTPSSAWETIDL